MRLYIFKGPRVLLETNPAFSRETRLLLASILTVGRSAREAEAVLREALKNTGVKPERVVTDGLSSYKAVVKNLFENSVEHL